MKMTRIYWKRFNRPFLSLASFALGCFITLSVLVADRVNARAQEQPTPTQELPDLSTTRIASFSQFGDRTTYRLIDSDRNTSTTDDLARQGFAIVPVNACLVRIENGVTHEEVRC